MSENNKIDLDIVRSSMTKFIDENTENIRNIKGYKNKADFLGEALEASIPKSSKKDVKDGINMIKESWKKSKIRYELVVFIVFYILTVICMIIILCIYEFYDAENKSISMKTFLYFLIPVTVGVSLLLIMISDNGLYKLGKAITPKKTFLGGADDKEADNRELDNEKSDNRELNDKKPISDYEKTIEEGTKRVLTFQEKTYLSNGILFGIFIFIILVIIIIVCLEYLGDGLNHDMGGGFKVKYLVYPLATTTLGVILGALAAKLHWVFKMGGRISKSPLAKIMVNKIESESESPISIKDSYQLYIDMTKKLETQVGIGNSESIDMLMYSLNK
jgi:hypothetical protein